METGGIPEGLGEDKPRTTDEVLQEAAKAPEAVKTEEQTDKTEKGNADN